MLAKISGGNGVVQIGSDSTLIPLGGRRVMLVPPPQTEDVGLVVVTDAPIGDEPGKNREIWSNIGLILIFLVFGGLQSKL